MNESQDPLWWLSKDGDETCLALYERHYSCRPIVNGKARNRFCGPGEKVVLRTFSGDACFVWRLERYRRDDQQGINCAVFRNESLHRSSDLIRQADEIADCVWPDSRHYTFVDASKVASRNPGYCFLAAGWKRCGFTKSGLLVLERLP